MPYTDLTHDQGIVHFSQGIMHLVEEMDSSGWMMSNVLEKRNQLTSVPTGPGAGTIVAHTIKLEQSVEGI